MNTKISFILLLGYPSCPVKIQILIIKLYSCFFHLQKNYLIFNEKSTFRTVTVMKSHSLAYHVSDKFLILKLNTQVELHF